MLGPQQYTAVSLPAKIFGLLADCLMEQFEQRRDEGDEWGAESDEDGDDDDDEFGEEVSVSKGGLSSDDFFSLLALGKELDADDGVDQDLDAEADPINQVGRRPRVHVACAPTVVAS
jgi:hypothetical protein